MSCNHPAHPLNQTCPPPFRHSKAHPSIPVALPSFNSLIASCISILVFVSHSLLLTHHLHFPIQLQQSWPLFLYPHSTVPQNIPSIYSLLPSFKFIVIVQCLLTEKVELVHSLSIVYYIVSRCCICMCSSSSFILSSSVSVYYEAYQWVFPE